MPVYLHIVTWVIRKEAVTERYRGGLEQFRKDHQIPEDEIKQEDDELFALGGMNYFDSITRKLIDSGLHFDDDLKRSDDFAVVFRYGHPMGSGKHLLWEADWIEQNTVFAWHVHTKNELKEEAKRRSSMKVHEIQAMIESGRNPFGTIV